MVPIRSAVPGPLYSLDRNEYTSGSRRQRRVCEADKGVEYWVGSTVPAEAVRTNDIRLGAARVLSALIHIVSYVSFYSIQPSRGSIASLSWSSRRLATTFLAVGWPDSTPA